MHWTNLNLSEVVITSSIKLYISFLPGTHCRLATRNTWSVQNSCRMAEEYLAVWSAVCCLGFRATNTPTVVQAVCVCRPRITVGRHLTLSFRDNSLRHYLGFLTRVKWLTNDAITTADTRYCLTRRHISTRWGGGIRFAFGFCQMIPFLCHRHEYTTSDHTYIINRIGMLIFRLSLCRQPVLRVCRKLFPFRWKELADDVITAGKATGKQTLHGLLKFKNRSSIILFPDRLLIVTFSRVGGYCYCRESLGISGRFLKWKCLPWLPKLQNAFFPTNTKHSRPTSIPNTLASSF